MSVSRIRFQHLRRVHLVCQAFRTVSHAELYPSPCCCRSCSSCVSGVHLSQAELHPIPVVAGRVRHVCQAFRSVRHSFILSLSLQVLQPGWRPVARGGGLGGTDPLQAGVGVWRGQDGPSLRDGRGLPLLLPPVPLQRHPGSVRLPLPPAPAAGSDGGRGPGGRGPAREEGQQRGGGREGYTRHPHGLPPPLLVTAIPQDSTVARDPAAHSGPWGRQQQQQQQ